MTGHSAGSSTMAQANGAAVRYQRRGDGQPIVLLHPLRMQLEYFDPLCAELGDTDAELIAVDLPGHGHSSAPAADYTAAYFTNAVEALLDNLNLAGAIVVGESIGASIGLGLAARHCGHFSSLENRPTSPLSSETSLSCPARTNPKRAPDGPPRPQPDSSP